jgi:hypothetical protein
VENTLHSSADSSRARWPETVRMMMRRRRRRRKMRRRKRKNYNSLLS